MTGQKMTRGNTQEAKMHYKGPNTGDDYVIYINPEAAAAWLKDRTIPLVDVLDGFFVFVSHKQGAQGILDRASNAQLDTEFGTHVIEDVAPVILEKGGVIKNKCAGRLVIVQQYGGCYIESHATHGALFTSAMITPKPILISGGGLASLLLARSLHRAKIPFLVFERDPSIVFRAQGYRLRLSAQGLDAIEQVLGPTDFQKFYDACGKTGGAGFASINPLTGEVLASTASTEAPSARIETLSSRQGKVVGISRGDMRKLFMEGVEDRVRWNHQVKGYESAEGGVRLVFADGSKSEEGSMLVGGEGVKSAVAGQLSNGAIKVYDLGPRGIHGQAPTTAFKNLGEGVFRMVDDTSQPNGGRVFLITNVRADDMDNPDIQFGWTMIGSPGVIKAPNDNYTITGSPAAQIAKSLTAHWHERVKPLFDNMVEAEAAFWKITCSSPKGVPEWPNDPRVTLVGDAVHAMTPAGGNGANTAVRDSALLGRLLAEAWERGHGEHWTGVTEAYEKEMRIYASEAVKDSYGQAGQFGVEGDIEDKPTLNELPMDPHASPRPRKRRAINACVNCRTSKVRCDGNRPCQRCDRNGAACQYFDAVKDENVLRIEKLEAEVAILRDQMQMPTRHVQCRNHSQYLVPIFCEQHDSITSVSSRSAILFDAIVSIGCRADEGFNTPTYRQLQARVRDHITYLIINTSVPTIEDIQAITLVAAYSENGFVLIAMALRFAMQLGLPNAVDRLIGKGHARSRAMSSDERELYRLCRVWHGICNLELFFSLDGGKLPGLTLQISARKIRSLLTHPERTPVDIRLLSQVELNIIRTEAYTKIMGRTSNFLLQQSEEQLRNAVDEASVELSLWLEEWRSIVLTEPVSHRRVLALQNLQIQHEWATMTLYLKAVASSGIENIAFMTDFQRDFIRRAKEAASRHLHYMLQSSASLSPNSSPVPTTPTTGSTYLSTFRWTLDYVWAKCAVSVLLVLKLAILLRDPAPSVMALLRDAHRVLEELKTVTVGYIAYFQILQTSIEKCEAALREYASEQDPSLDPGTGSDRNGSYAETEFQGYVPSEFVFEWDFPGLNLKHMPLGWQDLFVNIDNLF
ncbi:FAD-binding domain [Pyrenophora seminiperda CCB06]|uniref:FAD-binding domain n=1 Tax=Pyrenophora seminiperda CCB06 TaxID=1302712 RepID=A0A3M7M081_9PLEO|nr:FAD-binding domain [Pyrenophora seminiperda CCB06]